MSSQTKIIAAVGGILIVVAGAFWMFVANKPPAAPQTERGYHAP
jgi:hypothetical protein